MTSKLDQDTSMTMVEPKRCVKRRKSGAAPRMLAIPVSAFAAVRHQKKRLMLQPLALLRDLDRAQPRFPPDRVSLAIVWGLPHRAVIAALIEQRSRRETRANSGASGRNCYTNEVRLGGTICNPSFGSQLGLRNTKYLDSLIASRQGNRPPSRFVKKVRDGLNLRTHGERWRKTLQDSRNGAGKPRGQSRSNHG